MKHRLRQVAYAAASISIVLGLAAVPASALRVESHPIMSTDDTGTSNQSTVASPNTEPKTDTTDEPKDGLRSQAQQLLKTERENGKTRTTALRQKACEDRQKGITARTKAYGDTAEHHLTVFNQIFTKVQSFQTSKQLNVADYDTLVATAKAKQTAAQSAVEALKALDVQIDCTQSDPATTVATIKQAVANARTALQAYRDSLKSLIAALKSAVVTQSSNATKTLAGGAQ